MKKIILLVIILTLTVGCYDYVELNDLSIVNAIAIDKEDDEFKIAFEVLNTFKESQNEGNINSSVVSSSAKNLATAINNTSKKVFKKAYYAHLKVLILSDKLNDSDLKEIIDYFLRSPEIRNEFYVVLAKDSKASDILDSSDENNPVISTSIENMISNNKKRKNNSSPYHFEEIIQGIYNKNMDPAISVIKKENNKLSLEGLALCKDFKLVDYLSTEEAQLYNIIIGNAHNAELDFSCENGSINISIFDTANTIKYKDNKININLNLEGSVNQYTCKENIRDTKTLEKLDKIYSQKINDSITNLYNKLQKSKADILGIQDKYYIKTKKKKDWSLLNYEINTKLKINKEGLIFEL